MWKRRQFDMIQIQNISIPLRNVALIQLIQIHSSASPLWMCYKRIVRKSPEHQDKTHVTYPQMLRKRFDVLGKIGGISVPIVLGLGIAGFKSLQAAQEANMNARIRQES